MEPLRCKLCGFLHTQRQICPTLGDDIDSAADQQRALFDHPRVVGNRRSKNLHKAAPLITPPAESEAIDKLCDFVTREVRQLSRIIRQKAENEMNVSAYNKGGTGEYLPLLDIKVFNREKGRNGEVAGKVLAVREINSTGNSDKRKGPIKQPFHGLALDVRVGKNKYSFITRMEGYDIGKICAQMGGSDETDDWIGETLRFISNKSNKGNTVFVNVASIKAKGKKAKK